MRPANSLSIAQRCRARLPHVNQRLASKAAQTALLAALLGLVGGASFWLVPPTLDAWQQLSAQDDPEALTERGLRADLTATRLQTELESALDTDDVDLAASFIALGAQQDLPVPPALRERYQAATTPAAVAIRTAREFYHGARDGEGATGAGLAGVVASDLTGIGDVRDLIHQGQKISRGEEPDQLVLGLAAVGLAVTGATILSVGAALPARAGVSTIKVAAKTGRLSKPLAANLTRLVGDAVDTKAVSAAATAAASLDLAATRTAARAAIRPASVARLSSVAEDVTTIGRRAGVRGTHDALALTRETAELRKVAVLAGKRGVSTRAILKVLGRGAVVLTSSVLVLASWIMGSVVYLWLALLLALALLKRVMRLISWGSRRILRLLF